MPLWILLAFGSAFFAALVAVFGKLGLSGIDTTFATTARAAVMFALLLIFAGATGKLNDFSTLHGRPLLYIVLAGAAGALSWLCYFWALKLGRTAQVAVIDRFSVVIVILLAAAFLGEKLTWKTAAAALLMSAGAIVAII